MRKSILAVLLVGLFTPVSYGELVVTVFGPKRYERTNGRMNEFLDSFPAVRGKAELIILNGDSEGEDGVTDAKVWINDKKVLDKKDFEKGKGKGKGKSKGKGKRPREGTSVTRVKFRLQETNEIKVELKGKSSRYFTIEIAQDIEGKPFDPLGDTLGFGVVRHDIVSYSGITRGDELVLSVTFAESFSPPGSGQLDELVAGFLVDTDQNSGTGESIDSLLPVPLPDAFAVGLGIEFLVSSGVTGEFTVSSPTQVLGMIPATLTPSSMVLRVPLFLLGGDEGLVNIGLIVGTPETLGRAFEITDVAPNHGLMSVIEIIDVSPGPDSITITSPEMGSEVLADRVLVRGEIQVPPNSEAGVMVNGVPAEVSAGEFAAFVPLHLSTNVIAATLVSAAGAGMTDSVMIEVPTIGKESLRLVASPSSGINPLEVQFEARIRLENSLVQFELDFEGDGIVDFTSDNFENVRHTYSAEELHFPTLKVTDDSGIKTAATTPVNVMVLPDLVEKWSSMKDALRMGDVETALSFVAFESRDRFREIWQAIIPELSTIDSILPEIELVDVYRTSAEFQAVRSEDGVEERFYVLFIRDLDGVWRVRTM
jgi:hypothetical protein